MDYKNLIQRIENRIKQQSVGEGSGHDWWHIDRVRKLALTLARTERADAGITELAALLHDVADWKFQNGDQTETEIVRTLLQEEGADEDIIERVSTIVTGVSFKGVGVATPMESIEGKVVQDADRLDAIGAIGIARTFAYGGHVGQSLHDPTQKPQEHASFEEYKNNKTTTINHFYEKLLLLKDRLQTDSARRLAEHRHQYMEQFLDEFYNEWEGKV